MRPEQHMAPFPSTTTTTTTTTHSISTVVSLLAMLVILTAVPPADAGDCDYATSSGSCCSGEHNCFNGQTHQSCHNTGIGCGIVCIFSGLSFCTECTWCSLGYCQQSGSCSYSACTQVTDQSFCNRITSCTWCSTLGYCAANGACKTACTEITGSSLCGTATACTWCSTLGGWCRSSSAQICYPTCLDITSVGSTTCDAPPQCQWCSGLGGWCTTAVQTCVSSCQSLTPRGSTECVAPSQCQWCVEHNGRCKYDSELCITDTMSLTLSQSREYTSSPSTSFSSSVSTTSSASNSSTTSDSQSLTSSMSISTSVSTSPTATRSSSSSTSMSSSNSTSPTTTQSSSSSTSMSNSHSTSPTATRSYSPSITITNSYSQTTSMTLSVSRSMSATHGSVTRSKTSSLTVSYSNSDSLSESTSTSLETSSTLTSTMSETFSTSPSSSASASPSSTRSESQTESATLSPVIAEAIALNVLATSTTINNLVRVVYVLDGVASVQLSSIRGNATVAVWPTRADGTQVEQSFYRHPQPPLATSIEKVPPRNTAIAVPATEAPIPAIVQQTGTTLPLITEVTPSYDTEQVVNFTVSFQGGVYLRFAPVIVTLDALPVPAALRLHLNVVEPDPTTSTATIFPAICARSPFPTITAFAVDDVDTALPSLRGAAISLRTVGGRADVSFDGELGSIATPDWQLHNDELATGQLAESSNFSFTIVSTSALLNSLRVTQTLQVLPCPIILVSSSSDVQPTSSTGEDEMKRLFRIAREASLPPEDDPAVLEFYVPFSTLENDGALWCVVVAQHNSSTTITRSLTYRASPAHVRCNLSAGSVTDANSSDRDRAAASGGVIFVELRLERDDDDGDLQTSAPTLLQRVPLLTYIPAQEAPQLRFRHGGQMANQSSSSQTPDDLIPSVIISHDARRLDCVRSDWISPLSTKYNGSAVTDAATSPLGIYTIHLTSISAHITHEAYQVGWAGDVVESTQPTPHAIARIREASTSGTTSVKSSGAHEVFRDEMRGWEVCLAAVPSAAVAAHGGLSALVYYNVSIVVDITGTLTLWNGTTYESSDSIVIRWAPDLSCHDRHFSVVNKDPTPLVAGANTKMETDAVTATLWPPGHTNNTNIDPPHSVALEALFADQSRCHVTGAANQSHFEFNLARCIPALVEHIPVGITASPFMEELPFTVLAARQSSDNALLGGYMGVVNGARNTIRQPVVRALSGCPRDAFPSAIGCPTRGTAPLTIHGENFVLPDISLAVAFVFQDNPNEVPCQDLRAVSSTMLVCVAYAGFGNNGTVVVHARGDRSVVYARGLGLLSFGPNGADRCPIGDNGILCSGQGECDPNTGLCVCTRSSTLGYWGGADCSVCHHRYNDSEKCLVACPLDENNVVCSNRGPCKDGLCWCGTNWSSTACNGGDCPGVGTACSGHGVCDSELGVCRCNDPFAGPDCNECVSGMSGADCTTPCPTASSDGSICAGNGACFNGFCYCLPTFCGPTCELVVGVDDCALCPFPAQFGSACDGQCPGGSLLTPCTGRGMCSGGRYGTGQCLCNAGYGSSDCSVSCPVDSSGSVCGGFGSCSVVTGQCECQRFHAGPSCSIVCPGVSGGGLVCSGHGECDEGSAGSGICICAASYNGPDCNTTCLTASAIFSDTDAANTTTTESAPCYGRGTCLTTGGTCFCNADDILGYWDGASCDRCARMYAGPDCNGQCPTEDPNEPCSGHGTCGFDLICSCARSFLSGFWGGASCSTCIAGYYGATCTSECPGGSCAPCSHHGSCAQGALGNGTCTCHFNATHGYWTKEDCSTCISGMYGYLCLQDCVRNPDTGVICGNGTCNEGYSGDGSCTCAAGYATDPQRNGICTLCAPGFYGGTCQPCPTNNGVPCSGHGTCSDGLRGSGVCQCELGFVGSNCSISCPLALGRTCGNGECITNNTCSCAPFYALVNGTCTTCVTGMYGPACSLQCPACVFGSCTNIGTCKCDRGYWGLLCDEQCPGGVANPCSGNGTCVQATGLCECNYSPFGGFFIGDTCDSCDPKYNSPPTCRVPCPVYQGHVCYGRGSCFNGTCRACAPLANESNLIVLRCGDVCESIDQACTGNTCAFGFYGPKCNNVCPATAFDSHNTSLALSVCSGHGVCGTEGDCVCAAGYFDASCASSCPATSRGLCSSRGSCVNGTCVCWHGAHGPACDLECPGGYTSPCSGHGRCSITLGTCTCNTGYYGDACERQCPGGASTPCKYNGVCLENGFCECFSSSTKGHYAGDACENCAGVYYGPSCKKQCTLNQGSVVGRDCICYIGYVGAGCGLACPRLGPAVCSGHGDCEARTVTIAGSSSTTEVAACVCHKDYFTKACDVHCTVAKCLLDTGLYRVQCNPTTGTCECRDNILGHWTGPQCSRCTDGFWGTECSFPCPCNSHGTCHRYTSVCSCYNDDINGHWTGAGCSACGAGYTGELCTIVNVDLSPASNLVVMVAKPTATTPVVLVSVMDTRAGVILAQDATRLSTMLVIQSLAGGAVTQLGSVVLRGIPSAAYIFNSTHYWFVVSITPNNAGGGASQENEWISRSEVSALLSNSGGVVARRLSTTQQEQQQQDGRSSSSSEDGVPVTMHGSRRMDTPLAAAADTSASVEALLTFVHREEFMCTVYAPLLNVTAGHLQVNCTASSSTLVVSSVMIPTNSMYKSLSWVGISSDNTSTTLLIVGVPVDGEWASSDSSIGSWLACAADIGGISVPSVSNPTVATVGCWTNHNVSAQGDVVDCVAFALSSSLCLVYDRVNNANVLRVARLDFLTRTAAATTVETVKTAAPVVTVTTAIAAEELDIAVIAFHTSIFSGSTVYVVELSSTSLIGTLEQVGAAIVSGASLDVDLRLLFLAYDSSVSTVYRVVNLFGIKSVSPNVVDASGGAVITVNGVGFPSAQSSSSSQLPAWCNVSNTILPAVILNRTTLFCATTVVKNASGMCSKDLISILIGGLYSGRGTRSGAVGLYRPVAALCVSTVTVDGLWSYGPHDAQTTVTVVGFGFVKSNGATCRLQRIATGEVLYTTQRVEFINSTAVRCYQPSGLPPSHTPTGIAYSHDGVFFSDSVAPYTIVGPTSSVEAGEHNQKGETVVAAQVSVLPTIHIYTTDMYGNRRLRLDSNFSIAIRCSSLHAEVQAAGNPEVVRFPNTDQLQATLVDGVATFVGVQVGTPTAGTLTLYCFAPLDLTLNVSVSFTVVPGSPVAIEIAPNPAWRAGVTRALRLEPSPQVWLTDSAKNFVPGTEEFARVIFTSSYPDPTSNTRGHGVVVIKDPQTEYAKLNADGSYTFDTILIRTAFDAPATMKFSIGDVEQLSYTVAQESCVPGSEYAVSGTFACLPCPPEAVCDGSSQLLVQEGYWRAHRDSSEFYSCPDSVDACPGGTYTCNSGYEGIRCGTCAEGYGHSGASCTSCYSASVNWTVILLVLICFFIVVFVLSIVTMPATCYSEVELVNLQKVMERDPIAIVLKIVISHCQMLSMLPLQSLPVPVWLHTLAVASNFAKLQPSLSFFSCELASDDLAALHLVLATVLLSVAMFVPISLVAAFVLTRKGASVNREKSLLHRSAMPRGVVTRRAEREHVARIVAEDEPHFQDIIRVHDDYFSNAKSRKVLQIRFPWEKDQNAEEIASTDGDGNLLQRGSDGGSILSDTLGGSGRQSVGTASPKGHRIAMFKPTSPTPNRGSAATGGDGHATKVLWGNIIEENTADFRQRFVNMVAVSTFVILFVMYPTVVDACAGLLQCQTIDFGPNQPARSVVERDPSISCETKEYTAGLALSWGVLIGFGIGVPALCVLMIMQIGKWTCRGDLKAAKTIFFFTTGGYRDSVWYWEGISLSRKFMLVLAVTLSKDDKTRALLATWIMIATLILNIVARPWAERPLSIAEATSLASVAATFGMCTLLLVSPSISASATSDDGNSSNPPDVTAVYAAIAIVNLIAAGVFVFAILWSIRRSVALMSRRRGVLGNVARMLTEWLDDEFAVDVDKNNQNTAAQVEEKRTRICNVHPRTQCMMDAEVEAAEALHQSEETLLLLKALQKWKSEANLAAELSALPPQLSEMVSKASYGSAAFNSVFRKGDQTALRLEPSLRQAAARLHNLNESPRAASRATIRRLRSGGFTAAAQQLTATEQEEAFFGQTSLADIVALTAAEKRKKTGSGGSTMLMAFDGELSTDGGVPDRVSPRASSTSSMPPRCDSKNGVAACSSVSPTLSPRFNSEGTTSILRSSAFAQYRPMICTAAAAATADTPAAVAPLGSCLLPVASPRWAASSSGRTAQVVFDVDRNGTSRQSLQGSSDVVTNPLVRHPSSPKQSLASTSRLNISEVSVHIHHRSSEGGSDDGLLGSTASITSPGAWGRVLGGASAKVKASSPVFDMFGGSAASSPVERSIATCAASVRRALLRLHVTHEYCTLRLALLAVVHADDQALADMYATELQLVKAVARLRRAFHMLLSKQLKTNENYSPPYRE